MYNLYLLKFNNINSFNIYDLYIINKGFKFIYQKSKNIDVYISINRKSEIIGK